MRDESKNVAGKTRDAYSPKADSLPREGNLYGMSEPSSDARAPLPGVQSHTGSVEQKIPFKSPRKKKKQLTFEYDPQSGLPLEEDPQSDPKGNYFAECSFCNWKNYYANPYKAGLAAKWHAELWCPATKTLAQIAKDGELECYFCKENGRARGFKDFGLLAEHVQIDHFGRKGKEPFGWLECKCNTPLTCLIHSEKEKDDMLPQPGTRRGGDGGGTRTGKGSRPPAVPFLKVEDLNEEATLAKILGVATHNIRFNDVVLKLAIRGKSYFYGLRADNPNYAVLFEMLGDNENKWMGEEITIGLEWNDFYEKNFIRVFEREAKGKKGK